MFFLEVEGGNLINLDLVERVELLHKKHEKKANLWSGSVVLIAGSEIAYEFFTDPKNHKALMVDWERPQPKPVEAVA